MWIGKHFLQMRNGIFELVVDFDIVSSISVKFKSIVLMYIIVFATNQVDFQCGTQTLLLG